MSTIAGNPPLRVPATDHRPRRSLFTAAGVFAATGLYDLIAQPPGDQTYHSASTYAFTALLAPFALATLWALTDLRSSLRGADRRLGTVGFRIAATGLILLIPPVIASLATGTEQSLGPGYMLGMLLSLLGITLLSLALARAGALARWAAIALPAAWLLGGPIGEFRGAALILAAVFIAVAVTSKPRIDAS
jgi:hypothetical protein